MKQRIPVEFVGIDGPYWSEQGHAYFCVYLRLVNFTPRIFYKVRIYAPDELGAFAKLLRRMKWKRYKRRYRLVEGGLN